MAVQLHVAFSKTFIGAGIVAGGPYYCSRGSLLNSLACMDTANIPLDELVNVTTNYADQKEIDDTSNLQNSKVYLFSGDSDTVVLQRVMDVTHEYYKKFVKERNIEYRKQWGAEHAYITDTAEHPCFYLGPPFINNCKFDSIGAMLKHIYGDLNDKNPGETLSNPAPFSQVQFGNVNSMDFAGYIYVPPQCKGEHNNVRCKLVVALHGCDQSVTSVGMKFVLNTGFNQWADSNDIVVLYPQLAAGVGKITHTNQMGCWDWFGYTNEKFATKSGPQMKAIKQMVDTLVVH